MSPSPCIKDLFLIFCNGLSTLMHACMHACMPASSHPAPSSSCTSTAPLLLPLLLQSSIIFHVILLTYLLAAGHEKGFSVRWMEKQSWGSGGKGKSASSSVSSLIFLIPCLYLCLCLFETGRQTIRVAGSGQRVALGPSFSTSSMFGCNGRGDKLDR